MRAPRVKGTKYTKGAVKRPRGEMEGLQNMSNKSSKKKRKEETMEKQYVMGQSMRISRVKEQHETSNKNISQGFPGGVVVENLPANAGDTVSSPGLGRSHMPRSN